MERPYTVLGFPLTMPRLTSLCVKTSGEEKQNKSKQNKPLENYFYSSMAFWVYILKCPTLNMYILTCLKFNLFFFTILGKS